MFYKASRTIALLLVASMPLACAPLKPKKKDKGNGSDAVPGPDVTVEKGPAPTQAGTLTLNESARRDLVPLTTKKVPELFKPLCLTGASAYVPSVLVDGYFGIRHVGPNAVFELDDGGSDLSQQSGWAVKEFTNLPGTAYPDFATLTADAQIFDRPDFDGATSLGGSTNNFAMRAESSFNMPLARSVFLSLRARGQARILIDGTPAVATPITAANANPVAITATVDLPAGVHDIVVEYKQATGAAIFEARMRFASETTLRNLVATGATPFSVRVEGEEATPKSDLARAVDWPAVSGTENVTKCIHGLPTDDHIGYGEEAYVDITDVLAINEQTSHSVPAVLSPLGITSLWTAPSADVATQIKAVVTAPGEIGFSLNGRQAVKLPLSKFLDYGDDVVPDAAVAAVAAVRQSSSGARMLLLVTHGDDQSLVSIDYKPLDATLAGAVIDLPSEWAAPVAVLGSAGNFSLLKTASGIVAVRTDGRVWFEIASDHLGVTQRVVNGHLLGLDDDGVLFRASLDGISAALKQMDLALDSEAPAEPLAAEGVSFGLDGGGAMDLAMVWVDVFGQVWSIAGDDMVIHGIDGNPIAFFNPGDGQLYLSDADAVSGYVLSDGDKTLSEGDGGATILLRTAKVAGAKADLLGLTLTLTGGSTMSANLAQHIVSGSGDAPIKKVEDDEGGPIVNPGDPKDPPVIDVSFQRDVEPMIRRSCQGGGCHSGANAAAGLPLVTKEDMQVKFQSMYGSATPAGNMPLGGRAKLTTAELKTLTDWRDAMFPD